MPSIDVSRVRWLPETFDPMQETCVRWKAKVVQCHISAIEVPHEPPRLPKDGRTVL